ncbi:hypothetical protein [Nocardia pseudobrasiliensis]|uniref:hypothetical protein n=1 Tax=Nocardia pseudobrasiliensis TaxID=45979 RepID=UPI0008337AB7|nr:hypothetical protein [Nocardia pseudobrasiliensis]
MRGRITLSLIAIGAAIGALTVAPAQAAPVSGWVETHPDSKPFDYPAGEVCAFPAHVEFPVSELTQRVWYDPQGRPVYGTETGKLVLRATNVTTGGSVERDVSGDGSLLYPTMNADDYVLSGRDWAAGMHGGDQPAAARQHWFIARGFMSVRVTTAGGHTTRQLLALTGDYEDLCVTLAR